MSCFFFFQAEDGIRDYKVTGVQTCALPILALGGDQSNIEPLHLLVALLRQDDGPRSLLQRAGANVGQLQAAAEKALADRSEERRVGKEGRSRWWPYH